MQPTLAPLCSSSGSSGSSPGSGSGSSSSSSSDYGSRTRLGNPRVYKCTQCNRAFSREEHLSRHTLSTHNKLKPFSCGICFRAFSRRDLLLRHAKNLHAGSEFAVIRLRKPFKIAHATTFINTIPAPTATDLRADRAVHTELATTFFLRGDAGHHHCVSPQPHPVYLAPLQSHHKQAQMYASPAEPQPRHEPRHFSKMSVLTLMG